MSMYWLVDHRAPRYLPKTSDAADIFVVIGSVPIALAAFAFTLAGILAGDLPDRLFAIAALIIAAVWFRSVRRYVYRLPDAPGGYGDLDISEKVRKMQQHYRAHPDLRPVIEPVLIATYPLAVALDSRGVHDREQAVAQLVADARASTADPEVDNADLDELRNIIKIRRQMRSEGLL